MIGRGGFRVRRTCHERRQVRHGVNLLERAIALSLEIVTQAARFGTERPGHHLLLRLRRERLERWIERQGGNEQREIQESQARGLRRASKEASGPRQGHRTAPGRRQGDQQRAERHRPHQMVRRGRGDRGAANPRHGRDNPQPPAAWPPPPEVHEPDHERAGPDHARVQEDEAKRDGHARGAQGVQ